MILTAKGFEGDLVLNGFAEFIRNLLVCKDEKAAILLEVVESFRDKYISTAKEVSPALLISALNMLNEAEINYKAARNKRLHVELVLIKLCYLQQAIQLSSEGNAIGKKKLIETAKPVAFRHITPFEVKKTTVERSEATTGTRKSEKAKLIIETPEKTMVAEENAAYNESPAPGIRPETSKISALDKIRKQYKTNGANGNGNTNHPLQSEELQKAWAEYVIKLKETKNPAAQPFDLALLRVKDENSFEAVTANSIEKQFIEQDRNQLFTFLQEKLKNRLLRFNVIVEEKAENRPKIEITLTSKEQFQKMSEQYPLVKELKDRLRLELDY